jgi:transposase
MGIGMTCSTMFFRGGAEVEQVEQKRALHHRSTTPPPTGGAGGGGAGRGGGAEQALSAPVVDAKKAAAIAAEVAARYGVLCRPDVVRIIPRGVSGLPDPLAPEARSESLARFTQAFYGNQATRARAARLRKAEAAEAKPPKPAPAPRMTEQERQRLRDKVRLDARHAAAEATAAKLRAMAGAHPAEAAAALGMTELGVKRLAKRLGVELQKTVTRYRTSCDNMAKAIEARVVKGKDRRDAVLAMRATCDDCYQIAAVLGEKLTYVQNTCLAAGYASRRKSPVRSKPKGKVVDAQAKAAERRKEVARMFAAGHSHRRMAEALGVSQAQIYRDVMAQGLVRDEANGRPKSKWTQAQIDAIHALRAQRCSIREIAARVGLPPSTVGQMVKQAERVAA